MRLILAMPTALFAVVAPVTVLLSVARVMADVHIRRSPIQATADLAAEAQRGSDARLRFCAWQPTAEAVIAVGGVAVLGSRHGHRPLGHKTIFGGESVDALAVLT